MSAYIRTVDGANAFLGSRTITLNNSNATAPFGTIDTPTQGQTVSGTVTNFGWALTPQPNAIPMDGSTISVYVDGVFRGHPTYNNFRSDIATLFPGYANSGGAVGYFSLDTTTLSNGVHTIAWGVVDDVGHASGIGSRYFTVANASNLNFVATPLQYVQEPVASANSALATATNQRDFRESQIPPFGGIDSPMQDSTVAGRALVSGWALDLRDVALTVELLVDGRVVSRAPTRSERADVCVTYSFLPRCEGARPGFTFTWDVDAERDGVHTIAVRILDPAGNAAVVGDRAVLVLNRIGDHVAHGDDRAVTIGPLWAP